MVHGVFNPQYQRYGKKILVGTYLKPPQNKNYTAASLSLFSTESPLSLL
jgi:hypothetical protein